MRQPEAAGGVLALAVGVEDGDLGGDELAAVAYGQEGLEGEGAVGADGGRALDGVARGADLPRDGGAGERRAGEVDGRAGEADGLGHGVADVGAAELDGEGGGLERNHLPHIVGGAPGLHLGMEGAGEVLGNLELAGEGAGGVGLEVEGREGAGRAAVGEAFHDEGRGEARVGADGAGGGVAAEADDLEADGLAGPVEAAVGVEGEEGAGLGLAGDGGVVRDGDGLALPGDGGGERVVVGR